jgi:hypothetical protein
VYSARKRVRDIANVPQSSYAKPKTARHCATCALKKRESKKPASHKDFLHAIFAIHFSFRGVMSNFFDRATLSSEQRSGPKQHSKIIFTQHRKNRFRGVSLDRF